MEPDSATGVVAIKEKPAPKKQRISPSALRHQLRPCEVCGNRASGIHFGAITCEACKSFFWRSMRNDMTYKCFKEGSDEPCSLRQIKGTAIACPACRLQKCLQLNMSLHASKKGRYTHKRKAETISSSREYWLNNKKRLEQANTMGLTNGETVTPGMTVPSPPSQPGQSDQTPAQPLYQQQVNLVSNNMNVCNVQITNNVACSNHVPAHDHNMPTNLCTKPQLSSSCAYSNVPYDPDVKVIKRRSSMDKQLQIMDATDLCIRKNQVQYEDPFDEFAKGKFAFDETCLIQRYTDLGGILARDISEEYCSNVDYAFLNKWIAEKCKSHIDELIEKTIDAFDRQNFMPKSFVCKVSNIQRKFLSERTQKQRLFGAPETLPNEDYLKGFQGTGIDPDGRIELFMDYVEALEQFMLRTIRFVKRIPGYSTFPVDDQIAILRYSFLDQGVTVYFPTYNVEDGILSSNLLKSLSYDTKYIEQVHGTRVFTSFTAMIQKLQALEFTDQEYALLSAIYVMQPEHCITTDSAIKCGILQKNLKKASEKLLGRRMTQDEVKVAMEKIEEVEVVSKDIFREYDHNHRKFIIECQACFKIPLLVQQIFDIKPIQEAYH